MKDVGENGGVLIFSLLSFLPSKKAPPFSPEI
jgi:hypothetical protein